MTFTSSRYDSSMTARPGLAAAQLACGVGLLFAAVSLYWGLGGTWLLGTAGGALAQRVGASGPGLAFVAVGAAGAKTVGAVLPLTTFRALGRPGLRGVLRALSWVEAGVLTTYGLVWTSVGLLVQAGVLHSTDADPRALAWHTYLWDPWFLVWGLLLTTALVLRRRHERLVNGPLA